MVQIDPRANGDPEALCPEGCLKGFGSEDPFLQGLLGFEMMVWSAHRQEGAHAHWFPNGLTYHR